MDEILICKYENCNNYYIDPVILPCGKNICKSHIESLITDSSGQINQLKCHFCGCIHDLPIQHSGFIINKSLNEIISIHLNSKEKKGSTFVDTKDITFSELNMINSDPDQLIFSYVSSVREKIYLETESIMSKLEVMSKDMLDKLKRCKLKLERCKNFGLFQSTILTPEQSLELIKLCGFSNKDNFRLIYRASIDGFSSDDFHKNCDGVSRTLTLVKEKENGYIFGGYTESSWDSSNCFKIDNNAFVFSLLNREKKPIKMNVEYDHSAIYCGVSVGPSFGGGCDFEILYNLNGEKSYSKLGCSYIHPNYVFNSPEANSFLAGSLEFNTEEIEVYQIVSL
jgi:hypothetical protein